MGLGLIFADLIPRLIRGIVFFAVSVVLSPALAFASRDVCDGYLAKSNQLGCDSSNYLTSYGYRYCESFEAQAASFTPEGQETLGRLRLCLLKAINDATTLTCDSVQSFAAQSHLTCYVASGFCEMNPFDQMHVLWMVRDQVGTPEFNDVGAGIVSECALRGGL